MRPLAHRRRIEEVVEVERRIAAPPEEVFPYFTDPDLCLLWHGIEVELDPRPGGIFRVVLNDAGFVARGVYLQVEPPDRVVFSWGYEGNEGLPPGESTVDVRLTRDGEGTILRLRHSGLPSESACQIHSFGWNTLLDALVGLLSA